MSLAADHEFMARALQLAHRGIASTQPNPAVGCVIVKDGTIVGEGFTQRAGGNHAEIEALQAAGEAAAGATVYVSLEPCAHTGRTGPCTLALIEAAVARVVFALEDPNPSVAGKGASMLADAGIEVTTPMLADAAEGINRGYFSRVRRGRPWIRCKMAASLDGRTALANGQSQWITGVPARRDVHRWRARSSAVMVGIGTALADDPRLSARIDNASEDIVQPIRVVADSALRLPPQSKLLAGDAEAWIFTGASRDGPASGRFRDLEAAGARIEIISANPRLDLAELACRLAMRGVNDVLLEAGPTLAGAMLAADLVDELIFYFGPSLLGSDARGLFDLPPLAELRDSRRLVIDDIRKLGDDLRIVARPELD